MPKFDHNEYPKSFQRNEFWKQIKRTVAGIPVDEDQIKMIVDKIECELELTKLDHLLDLGSGNSALAYYLFDKIKLYTGVDFSDYLIGIAKEHFLIENKTFFFIDNMIDFVRLNKQKDIYTKVLIYGSASYLPVINIYKLVDTLYKKYNHLEKIFIGNIPDLDSSEKFYKNRGISDPNLDDPHSSIGIWWSQEQTYEKFNSIGFNTKITKMPSTFYSSNYRFDVTLSKKN